LNICVKLETKIHRIAAGTLSGRSENCFSPANWTTHGISRSIAKVLALHELTVSRKKSGLATDKVAVPAQIQQVSERFLKGNLMVPAHCDDTSTSRIRRRCKTVAFFVGTNTKC
jgi:hypothetical protein